MAAPSAHRAWRGSGSRGRLQPPPLPLVDRPPHLLRRRPRLCRCCHKKQPRDSGTGVHREGRGQGCPQGRPALSREPQHQASAHRLWTETRSAQAQLLSPLPCSGRHGPGRGPYRPWPRPALPLPRRVPAATPWPTEPLRQPTLPAHANRRRKDCGLISDGPLSPRGTPSSPLRLISREAAGHQASVGPTAGSCL